MTKHQYTYRLVLILVIILTVNLSFCQNETKIESLKKELKSTVQDSSQIEILLQLFWEYRRSNTGKAFEVANRSLIISRSIDYSKGIAQSLYCLGIICKIRGNFDESLDFINDAIDEFKRLNDTVQVISCLIDKGDIFIKKSDFQKGVQYLYEALTLSSKTDNKEKLSRIYSKLAGIYTSQKQYDKALEYHYKSLEINRKSDFRLGMSVNYNNIGNVFREMKQYNSATENYLKALEIKKEIGDNYGIATCLNNLGLIFSDQKDFNKALEYHFNALKQFNKLQDQIKSAMCYVNIANDYLGEKNNEKAVEYCNMSLKLSNNLKLKRLQTEAYRVLSEAYDALGNYKKALHFQRLYKIYNDSLVSLETITKINNLETKYEIEKREKEISLLHTEKLTNDLKMKQQRTQLYLLAGVVLLILVILGFLYWSFRNKQKLNRKLEELNLTKSRFFANISHEFRTPLTLLLGPLEKLLMKPEQEDKHLIELMYRNATRLLFLDNQLLDLSKLEAGKLKLKVCKGNITKSIRGMAISFKTLAEKNKINFKCLVPENDIQGWFDMDKLEKIVYNLLSNSFKFTPENGTVILELTIFSGKDKRKPPVKLRSSRGKIAAITVIDTGCGIAKKEQSLIFDRFYQAENVLSLYDPGTGLGLSLVKEFVELHYGKIQLQSEPEKGSMFKIFFPIDKDAYQENEITQFANNSSAEPTVENIFPDNNQKIKNGYLTRSEIKFSDENNIRLLIVDDDSDMRFYIKDCFDEQYYISEACNGDEAYKIAISEIPDIIISDLKMPGTDGIELCKKIKLDERTSHIPFILLSALATVEDRIKGLATGADDYISKPFNRTELKIRVRNLINQRNLLQELFCRGEIIHTDEMKIADPDKKFLDKLISFIENNISDPDLNVTSLTDEMSVSRSQLHRKLKGLTGMSATQFIRTIRINRAARLLKQHPATIAETVYAVGFNSISYFSKCFQRQFNMSPKEYIDNHSMQQ